MSESETKAPATTAQLPADPDTPDEQTGTEFREVILYVLAGLDETPYGLAIKSSLETYYGEELNQSRIYTNLDRLIQQGYVEKSTLDKRTNCYELTAEGRDYLRQDLAWKASQLGLTVEERQDQEER